MRAYLDFIRPDDILPLLVLIGMLAIINARLTRPDAAACRHARRAAAGTFAAYGVMSLMVLQIRSAGDLVMILLRCCLAAGVVHGLGALVLGVLTATIGDPVQAVITRIQTWRQARRARKAERLQRQRTAELQRREASERARRLPQEVEQQRQRAAAAELAERQRQERVADARAAVTQYYRAHAELLEDTLPSVLFESRMQTRFPDSLTAEKAWENAQEMLAEILPVVSAAKAKRQEDDRKEEQVQAEIERRRRKIERLRSDIQGITQNPGFEPEVTAPELRAIREQIRELELEIENLECEKEQP